MNKAPNDKENKKKERTTCQILPPLSMSISEGGNKSGKRAEDLKNHLISKIQRAKKGRCGK